MHINKSGIHTLSAYMHSVLHTQCGNPRQRVFIPNDIIPSRLSFSPIRVTVGGWDTHITQMRTYSSPRIQIQTILLHTTFLC